MSPRCDKAKRRSRRPSTTSYPWCSDPQSIPGGSLLRVQLQAARRRGGEGRGAAVTGEAAADWEAGPGPPATCSNLRRHAWAFCCGMKGRCPRPQDTLTVTPTQEAETAPSEGYSWGASGWLQQTPGLQATLVPGMQSISQTWRGSQWNQVYYGTNQQERST